MKRQRSAQKCFIDFDDTFFPSCMFGDDQGVTELVQPLDVVLSGFVRTIYDNNWEITIVSNASASWITGKLEYLPLTKKTIEDNNILVVSARDLFSDVTENWKDYAFKMLIDTSKTFKLVSIGDGLDEQQATEQFSSKIPTLTIKYKKHPNLRDLIEQNIYTKESWDTLSEFLEPTHIDIEKLLF